MTNHIDDMLQRAKTGAYEIHGDPVSADCVIAFSFGYRMNGGVMETGTANDDVAAFLQSNVPELPKIAEALVVPKSGLTGSVISIDSHAPGVYLTTRDVAVLAKEIMDGKGWKKAIIVAHPYHMPRADSVCANLGIETIALTGMQDIRFDPASDQPWTRNPELWMEKEAKSIAYYAERGWI
jgi:DUF218 domain